MKTVFINEARGNWILKILGDDIYSGLCNIGFDCRKGSFQDYNGEEISLHMWWRHAHPYKDAKINSVFVTHIDDIIKEHDLCSMKDEFDVFFCMSPEDAVFLEELGFDKSKVFGLNLPTRNTYVRPLSIAIFSNCYTKMKVKHEQWLLDYCSQNKKARLVNFCFIGHGWSEICNQLSELGCSFEWHCVDRSLPHEYMFQQLKLVNMDYYLYMGMDGGAMGTYDAYAMGAELCVADDGYHKSIPDFAYKFLDQEGFNKCLDQIIEKQLRRIDFFAKNSVENYVKSVGYILQNKKYPEGNDSISILDYSVKEKRKSNYFSLSFKRIRQPLVSAIIKAKESFLLRNKAK